MHAKLSTAHIEKLRETLLDCAYIENDRAIINCLCDMALESVSDEGVAAMKLKEIADLLANWRERMSIPYIIGFGDKLPKISEGDPIICPQCHGVHKLKCGTENGVKTDLVMFYKCGEEAYLGAVTGKLVAGLRPDISSQP